MRPNAKMYPYYGKFLAFGKGTLQKMRKMAMYRFTDFIDSRSRRSFGNVVPKRAASAKR